MTNETEQTTLTLTSEERDALLEALRNEAECSDENAAEAENDGDHEEAAEAREYAATLRRLRARACGVPGA